MALYQQDWHCERHGYYSLHVFTSRPTLRFLVQNFTENAIADNRKSRKGILAPVVEEIGTGKSISDHTKEQMLAEGLFTTFTGKNYEL